MFAQSMTAPCQRSQKGRTWQQRCEVHDKLHAAISDRRSRRVPQGPARPRPRPRRRCMETVPGPRRKMKTRFLSPFLVLRLPTRSRLGATQGEGRVPHKTPEERRRPVPLIWCALSRNEAESQQGHGRSAQRPWLRGICPGIVGPPALSHWLRPRVPEKLPCPFPSPFPTLDSLNAETKMSRNASHVLSDHALSCGAG